METKKRLMTIIVIMLSMVMYLTLVNGRYVLEAAQAAVWVTSANCSLTDAPKATARKVVAVLPGTELNVLTVQDKWYQVSTLEGAKGWIYRGKVAMAKPSGGPSNMLLSKAGPSSISAETADTSRSIRGLSPETKAYADTAGTPDASRKALDQVMAFRTTNDEIDTFLKAGKVGEFAQ